MLQFEKVIINSISSGSMKVHWLLTPNMNSLRSGALSNKCLFIGMRNDSCFCSVLVPSWRLQFYCSFIWISRSLWIVPILWLFLLLFMVMFWVWKLCTIILLRFLNSFDTFFYLFSTYCNWGNPEVEILSGVSYETCSSIDIMYIRLNNDM